MSAWFESWTGLALRAPAFCALLLPLFALAWWSRRRGGAAAVTFAPGGLLVQAEPMPRSWRMRCAGLPTVLAVAAIALSTVAMMRPVQRVMLPAVRQGIDIVLCLDVSSSMANKDLDPLRDRLDVARAAAIAFVGGRADDRIGLVRFARFPDLVCPPTQDHHALEQFLGDLGLVPRDGPEDATGIGTAIARAVQVLARSESPSRVVVLVTDGEENVAAAGTANEIGPLQAAQLAERHGVKVYALAVGQTGGGQPAIDTSQIEQLAQRSGGRFFAARDAAAIAGVYREISGLERFDIAAPRFRLDDQFLPFAIAALLAMLSSVVLRRTWLEVLP